MVGRARALRDVPVTLGQYEKRLLPLRAGGLLGRLRSNVKQTSTMIPVDAVADHIAQACSSIGTLEGASHVTSSPHVLHGTRDSMPAR